MTRQRREALQAGLCLLGSTLAGCLSGSGTPTESPGTESPSTHDGTASLAPGETYEKPEGWSLTVENVAVQNTVVEFATTHPDPVYGNGEQFVVADAVVTGAAPDPADLNVFVRTDTLDGSGRVYVRADSNEDDVRQRFGFPVPVSPTASQGAIVWEPDEGQTVRWELSAKMLKTIARPPEFELHEFEVEDVPGDKVEATLTVENTGEGDGTFVAEVGDAMISDQPEVFVDVPAGETVTVTRKVWAEFRDRKELTVVLRWRGEKLERTVQES